MRYWVYHQGVPLGIVDLTGGELVVAEFEPSDAYLSVRSTIREASVALWSMGFFHPEGVQQLVSVEAPGRAAKLSFELRDAEGKLIPADFVNVVERPHTEDGPVLFVRFRHAHSGVASVVHLPHKKGGAAKSSDA